MRRRRVEVVVVLLDVLAMIALRGHEPKEAFLQKWIFPVPEGERKTDELMPIADAADAVLSPPVGARAGMVMRKVIPCRSTFAVVLANRSPLALAHVRSPTFPMAASVA